MKVLELFSGTASFSNVWKEAGHQVLTIDIDPKLKPDWCIDIMDLEAEHIINYFGKPDVIWASPPCQTFSVASLRCYWKDGKPKNKKCLQGIELVKHTLKIINELKPKYWFIENPRGMLRKMDFMPENSRKYVTYCRYGKPYMKPTDIWTNCDLWKPRIPCNQGDRCHESAPRGSHRGIEGIKNKAGALANLQRAPL